MCVMQKIKCPICDKDVKFYRNKKLPPGFPFCSQRCKLVDLGKWLGEEYSFSDPVPEGYVTADDES